MTDALTTHRDLDPVRLVPSRGAAGQWTAWAVLLVAAGAWFVVDSNGHPLALVALVAFVAVLAWFLVQLALPTRFQVILDPDVLWARHLWRRTTIDWDDVYVTQVIQVFGDPALEVRTAQRTASGDLMAGPRRVLPLPVGSDVRAVHRFLAARLGHGALAAPVRLEPLDL